jgi:hypothetical protein
VTLKNLIVKSTKFSHHNIHKYICTLPDGIIHNQIDHVLVYKMRQSSIIDIHSLTGTNCDIDHYLVVVNIQERLSLKKGINQHLVLDRYNLNKLLDHQTRKEYQVDVANRFSVLEGLEISSVDDTWVKIRDSIKSSAEEKVGILETHRNKTWFNQEWSELANKEKQEIITLATKSK